MKSEVIIPFVRLSDLINAVASKSSKFEKTIQE